MRQVEDTDSTVKCNNVTVKLSLCFNWAPRHEGEAWWAPEPVWTRWWIEKFPVPAGTLSPTLNNPCASIIASLNDLQINVCEVYFNKH
jgi:hypothetical protein